MLLLRLSLLLLSLLLWRLSERVRRGKMKMGGWLGGDVFYFTPRGLVYKYIEFSIVFCL